MTLQPSKKTSYMIVGDVPGESKVKKAETLGLQMLDEDSFFELIRTSKGHARPSSTPAKAKKKPASNTTSPIAAKVKGKGPAVVAPPSDLAHVQASTAVPKYRGLASDQLWTDRYAPATVADLIGNQIIGKRLSEFLRSWSSSTGGTVENGGRTQKDGGTFRAALLSGAPGLGKTSTAHVVAKAQGYDVIEFNASDTRSKNALKSLVKEVIDNTSITEFFVPDEVNVCGFVNF